MSSEQKLERLAIQINSLVDQLGAGFREAVREGFEYPGDIDPVVVHALREMYIPIRDIDDVEEEDRDDPYWRDGLVYQEQEDFLTLALPTINGLLLHKLRLHAASGYSVGCPLATPPPPEKPWLRQPPVVVSTVSMDELPSIGSFGIDPTKPDRLSVVPHHAARMFAIHVEDDDWLLSDLDLAKPGHLHLFLFRQFVEF